jgi:transcriptional regulator with XRE-family HTH domain
MSEMELYRRLGRAIAERRASLELTQSQLAARISLTRASVANLENGRQRIMVHQLFALANALELDSILKLVPTTWSFEPLPNITVKGAPLSAREQSAVQSVLASALANPGKRS